MESLNIHLSWAPLRSVTFKPPTTRLTGSDRYVKPNTLGFEDHLYLHFQDLKTALDKDHMPPSRRMISVRQRLLSLKKLSRS